MDDILSKEQRKLASAEKIASKKKRRAETGRIHPHIALLFRHRIARIADTLLHLVHCTEHPKGVQQLFSAIRSHRLPISALTQNSGILMSRYRLFGGIGKNFYRIYNCNDKLGR